MRDFLNGIRVPSGKMPFAKALMRTVAAAVFGVLLGAAAKLMDIYTENLGNIFSQMSVWIFICTAMAVFSSSPYRAAANVFCFCTGMIVAYYITAHITESVYSIIFVYGWTAFSLVSPLLAFCTWYAAGKGVAANIIAVLIISVMLMAAVILFDKIRISDVLFAATTVGVIAAVRKRIN